MSDEPNQDQPPNDEGQGSARPVILLLVAAAVLVAGVFTQNILVVGIGLLAAIVAFYLLRDATAMPVVSPFALLVGASLLLAGLSALLSYRDIHNPFIPWLWLASMVVGLAAAARLDRALPQVAESPARPAIRFNSAIWLIPIILLAFALRIHALEAYPPFHGDEGEMGLAALRVLSGDTPPPTATGWLDHPALFHYLHAVPLAIFGQNGFALRLPSVIAGVLCVPLVYVIGRRWWGPVAGLSAAWFLAVAHLHVHFSRIGLNNIESVLFLLLFMFLMTRIRPHRVTVYLLAGLVVGLAQYMYYGSRVLLFIAPLLLLFTWRRKMSSGRQLAAFGIGVVLAILPLVVFYVRQPDPLVSRARGVFVLSDNGARHVLQSEEASFPDDILPVLGEQVKRNLSFFIADGDRSPFYIATVPGLDIVTAVLFWLGVGLAITRLFRFPAYAILVWIALVILIGGVLTIDSPNAPRLLIAIPAVALLAGLVLQRGATWLSAYPRQVKVALLLAIFAAAALLNIKIYFGDFDRDLPPGNLGVDMLAREIRSAGGAYEIYLLGEPNLFAHYGTIQFLGNSEVQDLASAADVQVQPGKGLLFIALANHADTLAEIKQRWPGGESQSYVNANDVPLYDSYWVASP